MKELIEEFKKNNGNEKVTQKDLLYFLAAKIDKFDEKLDSISETSKVNQNSIYFLKWVVGFMFVVIIAIVL